MQTRWVFYPGERRAILRFGFRAKLNVPVITFLIGDGGFSVYRLEPVIGKRNNMVFL